MKPISTWAPPLFPPSFFFPFATKDPRPLVTHLPEFLSYNHDSVAVTCHIKEHVISTTMPPDNKRNDGVRNQSIHKATHPPP